ncbi:MAG: hypothetical protein HYV41_01640 [Candidatus Magasanikbacteria bacterium]|nr:hypothetical protein [Candidatus Magasanikbacteria bacterium]
MDLLQLGAQFLQVTEVKDFPRLLIDLPEAEWQRFFLSEAEQLRKQVLE